MPKYFDIHSHLNFPEYDKDREEVIQGLKDADIWTICVGTDFATSKSAVELADKHENIYACIGVHPVGVTEQSFDTEQFESLVSNPKVVAIGECGLDFHHADKANDFERQKNLFEQQIEFAIVHNKYLMIHARDAYDELLEILEPLKQKYGDRLKGNIHFFAGDKNIAERLFKIGFTISFTGVVTFARDYDEVIKSAPINMVMSETDAPFAAPVPHRGERNEPGYVREVVKKLAEIRGEDEGIVGSALVNNALRMLG